MSSASAAAPGAIFRFYNRSRILYKEAQYWLVGLTPEHYHLYQARRWRELCNYDAAVKHLRKYLACSNKPEVRAELGWCLSLGGRWADAAAEYETAASQLSYPSLRIALAEALFHGGNPQRGAEVVRDIEKEISTLPDSSRAALAGLMNEFGLSPNTSPERSRGPDLNR